MKIRPKPEALRIERTYNIGLVRAILTNPAVYRMASDDGSVGVEKISPAEHTLMWHVVAYDGVRPLGLLAFHAENSFCAGIHIALLPSAWGMAEPVARAGLEWMWRESDAVRINARIPAFNQLAIALAKRVGMREFGRCPGSCVKWGRRWDEVFLGIDRPEVN